MGLILAAAAVIGELLLTACCVITRSEQLRARCILRIASFGTFVLLTLLQVIQWSFRYYAIAALLLVLSLSGARQLLLKRPGTLRGCSTARSAVIALLFVMMSLPAILFPQHPRVIPPTGTSQVATLVRTWIDSSRSETSRDTGAYRALTVQFWYPESSDSTHPLIVFSHGGLGTRTSNVSLFNELASHGYVVCSIDHTYQCLFTTDEHGDTTLIDTGYVRELFAEDALSDQQHSLDSYRRWMKLRTDDIDFVIDRILAEARSPAADELYTLVDTTRIGVMGHSLGGSAAYGIGRRRADVSAVIGLEAPLMCDIMTVEHDRFVFDDTAYPVPVLNIYSDSAWHILSERPQYATNHAMLSDTDPDIHNLHLEGVGHLALTDLGLSSPLLTRMLDRQGSTALDHLSSLTAISRNALDFFDSYLKGQGPFTAEAYSR
jgi:dienelactone hydrolase